MNYIWIYQYLNFTKDGLNFVLNTEEIGLTASTNSSIIKATTQKKLSKNTKILLKLRLVRISIKFYQHMSM